MFVLNDLQMSGRWSSARGDTLHFTNAAYSLKWNSSSDKKLLIVDGDENNQLAATIASFAQRMPLLKTK